MGDFYIPRSTLATLPTYNTGNSPDFLRQQIYLTLSTSFPDHNKSLLSYVSNHASNIGNLNTSRENGNMALTPLSQFSKALTARSSELYMQEIDDRDLLGSYAILYRTPTNLGVGYSLAQVVDNNGDQRIMAVGDLREKSFSGCMISLETHSLVKAGSDSSVSERGAFTKITPPPDVTSVAGELYVPQVLIIESLLIMEMTQMGVKTLPNVQNYAIAAEERLSTNTNDENSEPYEVILFKNGPCPTTMTKAEAKNSWNAINIWSTKLLQYNAPAFNEIREGFSTNYDYISACFRWFYEVNTDYNNVVSILDSPDCKLTYDSSVLSGTFTSGLVRTIMERGVRVVAGGESIVWISSRIDRERQVIGDSEGEFERFIANRIISNATATANTTTIGEIEIRNARSAQWGEERVRVREEIESEDRNNAAEEERNAGRAQDGFNAMNGFNVLRGRGRGIRAGEDDDDDEDDDIFNFMDELDFDVDGDANNLGMPARLRDARRARLGRMMMLPAVRGRAENRAREVNERRIINERAVREEAEAERVERGLREEREAEERDRELELREARQNERNAGVLAIRDLDMREAMTIGLREERARDDERRDERERITRARAGRFRNRDRTFERLIQRMMHGHPADPGLLHPNREAAANREPERWGNEDGLIDEEIKIFVVERRDVAIEGDDEAALRVREGALMAAGEAGERRRAAPWGRLRERALDVRMRMGREERELELLERSVRGEGWERHDDRGPGRTEDKFSLEIISIPHHGTEQQLQQQQQQHYRFFECRMCSTIGNSTITNQFIGCISLNNIKGVSPLVNPPPPNPPAEPTARAPVDEYPYRKQWNMKRKPWLAARKEKEKKLRAFKTNLFLAYNQLDIRGEGNARNDPLIDKTTVLYGVYSAIGSIDVRRVIFEYLSPDNV